MKTSARHYARHSIIIITGYRSHFFFSISVFSLFKRTDTLFRYNITDNTKHSSPMKSAIHIYWKINYLVGSTRKSCKLQRLRETSPHNATPTQQNATLHDTKPTQQNATPHDATPSQHNTSRNDTILYVTYALLIQVLPTSIVILYINTF